MLVLGTVCVCVCVCVCVVDAVSRPASLSFNPHMTLSSWLAAPPSRLFHPTQNNIVHLAPPTRPLHPPQIARDTETQALCPEGF